METKKSSKIVTQIDIQIAPEIKKAFEIESKIESEKDTLSPLEMFLDDQNNCPLCGDEMLITHVAHFLNQTVKEEAHCDACKIRVRENQHLLQ